MKTSIRSIAFALVLSGFAGAADHARHGAAATAGGVTSLDIYARGEVIDVLTAESSGSQPATLWHRRSSDGGKSWSGPHRVDAGLPPPRRPHRGDDAQVAFDGRHIIAAWSTPGNGWLGTGRLITAYSADGGKTWSRGTSPAGDERHDGQSYADIAAREGRFHLAWLDTRGGTQGVRYATSADGGASWQHNVALQPGSCECCWSTVLAGPRDAVYALYRAKSPRDMAMSISRDGGTQWSAPAIVGNFNWQSEACPHTGGALALSGQTGAETLHALVWTGKDGARGLHVLSAAAVQPAWTKPVRLGGEFAQRGDLAARGDEVVAVWDEPGARASAIFLARSLDGGASWSQPSRLSAETAHAVYPRVVATRSNLLVAWTEAVGSESRLRMLLVK